MASANLIPTPRLFTLMRIITLSIISIMHRNMGLRIPLDTALTIQSRLVACHSTSKRLFFFFLILQGIYDMLNEPISRYFWMSKSYRAFFLSPSSVWLKVVPCRWEPSANTSTSIDCRGDCAETREFMRVMLLTKIQVFFYVDVKKVRQTSE